MRHRARLDAVVQTASPVRWNDPRARESGYVAVLTDRSSPQTFRLNGCEDEMSS